MSAVADHRWPDIHVAGWSPTKRSLHLYTQMLGKLRVALSPSQPNWMFTALPLTARGITTGAIPWRDTAIQATIDVLSSELLLESSTGRSRRIALVPARTVAQVYAEFVAALDALEIDCAISPVPQEVADLTPMDRDDRAPAYEAQAVQKWFAAATAIAGIFDEWRAGFFGRSGIQLWWGAMDLAMILFNGKHAPTPAGSNFLLRYDLDAEMMNVGFFCGDERTAPMFYGYVFPQPPGAEALAIAPAGATWSSEMKEWILPYDAVRQSTDPGAALRTFLDALYENCVSAAGWDRASLSYDAPKRARFQ
ncbi:MAG: hypothetical protein NVSMB31_17420 [Vulcanimicrobiaceae bacterium]